MSLALRRRARAVAGLALLLACAGCGGGDRPADEAAAAKAYTAEVATVSQNASRRLGALADRSDYRDGDTAARSTRAYAAAIREAAKGLRAAQAPAAVQGTHRSLIKLYDDTARSLDTLAQRFGEAPDAPALAELAQELGTAVQQYSTQEQVLRNAILVALGEGSGTTATSPTAPPADR